MSFAKNYLKQYNADTAWDSLRGGTSAYDYSSMPEYAENFRRIFSASQKPKQFAKDVEDMSDIVYGYVGNAKRRKGKYAQLDNLYDLNAITNSVFGNGTLERINQMPQQLMNNTLAGRYASGFPTFGVSTFL